MQQPTAIWNSKLQVWITNQDYLFSEQDQLWQEALPTSGMTVNGQLFELAMPVRHTEGNESSFSRLPTVRAAQGDNRNSNIWERDASKPQNLENALWKQVLTTNWGKFEPAIRRWEQLTRPAPAPTKPDEKDGKHRLSSAFTEWMMGLPDGWVTGHGLKRNDELKMCGNGVVPQQAELALRYLLGQTDIPKG
jgi:hypothetical protein